MALVVICCLLAFDSPAVADDSAQNAITINPAVLKLGLVEPGKQTASQFTLENHSRKDLRVLRVRSTCTCLRVLDPPEQVDGDKNATIKVEFDAPDKVTPYSATIYLHTDSPAQPKIALTVKARVGLPLAIEPATLDAGSLIVGQVWDSQLVLVNSGDSAVKVAYATSSCPSAVARVPKAAVAAGEKLKIPLTFGPFAKAGKVSADVTVHTTSPAQPKLTAKISGEVDDAYSIEPGLIDVGKLHAGASRTFQLLLVPAPTPTPAPATAPRDTTVEPFIEKIDVGGVEGAACATAVTHGGGKATIAVTITAEPSPKELAGATSGGISGTIKLRIKGRKAPVTVPVRGLIVSATPAANAPAPSPAPAPAPAFASASAPALKSSKVGPGK